MTATKPQIELRKLKQIKSLSEETPAYTADVWVDGKLFCHASNHGHGGCDMQRAPKGMTGAEFDPLFDALQARIKATYAPHSFKAGNETMTLDYDLELVCHMLIADAEIEKGLKRDLSKRILFTKEDGKIYQMVVPAAHRVPTIALLKGRPEVRAILNELPIAEAVAIYKAA